MGAFWVSPIGMDHCLWNHLERTSFLWKDHLVHCFVSLLRTYHFILQISHFGRSFYWHLEVRKLTQTYFVK